MLTGPMAVYAAELQDQLEALQKKYDRLYEKTLKTRGWQRQFYTYHVGSDKQIMMRHQRELDAMLLAETNERKRKQHKLAL